ncbi:hypothetical protein E2562_013554 [Oryza meyeriana var. granulata]|uniref:Uncharacterized protein n=1 Tax=Oryza meyeriana var. granulata TaxID=110450 RepID=A0A6G1D4C7_9ORYZ|nr:hypothetical protein E2562_013554 [Oryza meyeriana var. granulata]
MRSGGFSGLRGWPGQLQTSYRWWVAIGCGDSKVAVVSSVMSQERTVGGGSVAGKRAPTN